ncbi:hypothetical protein HWV62_13457 [Athelia sp. TMB]|nr:hypothetical protein HWV62_13457 [Athelia sp. TMB]
MVSSNLVDTVNDPTRTLKELYDPSKDIDAFPSSVAAHFAKIFDSPKALDEIPVVDIRHPPESHAPRALVRFRAMVQDTSPSPEMYLAKLADGKCGGWGLGFTEEDANPDAEPDYDYADLRECTVLWAVSVPGESEWLAEPGGAFIARTTRKMANDRDSGASDVKAHQPAQPHKYPLPGAPHIGVQVKIYDNSNPDSIKATDILTFTGILTLEPLHSNPELNVPTLHVLFSVPHPLSGYTPAAPEPDAQVRGELVAWIADAALAGDHDAAEWVLLTAVARVQSRNPPILPPSLTLARFPPPPPGASAPALAHVLRQILPLSATLPLSLPLLNTASFVPESKDEDLHAGYLQLPAGCTVLVTESGVAEGKVVEKGLPPSSHKLDLILMLRWICGAAGIVNIKALQDVLHAQTLPYVFPYSSFAFPTDLGFVLLAEGRKSAFFQTNVTIPLQPAADRAGDLYRAPDSIVLPPPEKLAQFRRLVLAAKTGTVQVAAAAADAIQDDFVADRQRDKGITAEDLILQMSVARLEALSLGEPEVTPEIWDRAKALDRRRTERATV